MGNEKLWEPSAEQKFQTNLATFMRMQDIGCSSSKLEYDALWEYSISKLDQFWDGIWDFVGIKGTKGGVVYQPHSHIRDCQFFPQAKLNFTENLLSKRGSDPAVIFYGENDHSREISWDELWTYVAVLQSKLLDLGIRKGDVVGGITTNSPEAVIAMLAATSIGAIWTSCSPDFGISGIVDRFGQVCPKVIFGVEGYFYNGSWFDCVEKWVEVQNKIPSINRMIYIPYDGERFKNSDTLSKGISWKDCISKTQAASIHFEPMPFSTPLYIMFSSGTTGKPKCIIHRAGGVLLQHKKEHILHYNLFPSDRMMFFTTCGWMMWNWVVSAIASQATLVLYDGSPVYPDAERLCQIIENSRVNQLGASAKYFEICSNSFRPKGKYDLSSLRTLMSTGSPLMNEVFDYLYQDWKSDFCVSSMSGGTDILCCFVGGSPINPVYRGQCQKRMLGMNVMVFDENGHPVKEQPGELVCGSPHPSIPIGLLGDKNNQKFNAAYFDKFVGVWHQSDWVKLTNEGGMVFYGRSDSTLNPGGVRIGTAEIYRPVEQIPEIEESLVIERKVSNESEIILFIKLFGKRELSEDLIQTIKHQIRSLASPRHIPNRIIQINDLPRTRSGKLVELAVRDIIHGKTINNLETLANPEALEQFKTIRQKLDAER